MAIDDVEDDGEAELVGLIDETLEVGAVAEALVHAEEADRLEAPVDSGLHIRDRHHFDAVDAKIRKVRQPRRRAREIVLKLVRHQFV